MTYTQLSSEEIVAKKGSEVAVDIECYKNYFLVNVKYIECGSTVWFEGMNVNKKKLKWILENNVVVTFNGHHYDMIMLMFFLSREVCSERMLYDLSQEIIGENTPTWKVLRDNNIPTWDFKFNHIDLKELSFGEGSLKLYAGRLHSPFMQDLPYPFYEELDNSQKYEVFKYCWNDLDNTIILRKFLEPDIKLRIEMGRNYSADLRSKSDAQIAEVIFARELKWKHGIIAERPTIAPDYMFKYTVPDDVKFETKQLQDVLEVIRAAEFRLSEAGVVQMPDSIKSLNIKIADTIYTMGMGGLHSTESWMHYPEDTEYLIFDRDVASYYPRIILNQGLYPKHLTKHFLTIYNSVVERRLAAKESGDKLTANSLKIVINGSFGKFGSVYSILFSPDLLIQTTISGQLYLLMLIERLHLAGMTIISGNTDGIVIRIKKELKDECDRIIGRWEKDTRFVTEETPYCQYWARDVNNYVAVKPDGSVKTKGCFGKSGISKNPSGEIIFRAVSEYISRGRDINDTVNSNSDPRAFLFVRTVKGGCVSAEKVNVGKVIRFYKAKGEFGHLSYATNGNKVPLTDGCIPHMELTNELPSDIDYAYYIREAKKILNTWLRKPEQYKLDFWT